MMFSAWFLMLTLRHFWVQGVDGAGAAGKKQNFLWGEER
jgi:hypothetical protein